MSLPVQFATPLGIVPWLVLAGVPVGIIALYFLKLRRRPVQVPSTLLWRRSIEDLHVNSLFQRLRRNLLLFLQLLAVFLAMLALAGPRVEGTTGQGQRFVLAIDNSASMSATDIAPSRLDRAKQEARKIVQGMEAGRPGDGHRLLRPRQGRLELHRRPPPAPPADRRDRADRGPTSLREALQVAAGLANPSKQIGEGAVATAVATPKLKIYTDGGFPDVEGFSLGNLEPEVIVIGPPPPPKLRPRPATTSSRRPIPRPRSRPTTSPSSPCSRGGTTSGPTPTRSSAASTTTAPRRSRPRPSSTGTTPTSPRARGTLIDAIALKLAPQSDQSFKFDLPDTGMSELEVRLTVADALPLDNHASTVVGNPRKAQVLVVTKGNRYLEDTLKTPTAVERADVTVVTPEDAKSQAGRPRRRVGPLRPGDLRRRPARGAPRGERALFRRAAPRPGLCQAEDDRAAGHPRLGRRAPAPPVRPRPADGRDPQGDHRRPAPRLDGPDRERQGAARLRRPARGVLRHRRRLRADGGRQVQHQLVSEHQLPAVPVQQHPGAGQRPRIGRRRGPPARPAGDPPHRWRRTRSRSPRPTARAGCSVGRRKGRSWTTEPTPSASTTPRWDPDGRLAFAVNLFDARESDLAPRGLVPEGVPESQADAYKIKIGFNPVAGIAEHAPGPARMVVAAGASWRWSSCSSSGISTTNVSSSEPEMEAGEARPRGSDPQ